MVQSFAKKTPPRSREVSLLIDARKREHKIWLEGGVTVSPKFGKLRKPGLEMVKIVKKGEPDPRGIIP